MSMNEAADSQAESLEERRGFLRGLLATGSGVAVLAATQGAAIAAVKEEAESAPQDTAGSKGYHVTQQVLDYYKTAAL
jgi:hypothetical protein